MIRNVASSAARLPLAPAKLALRMAGSLLEQVRGDDGAGEPQRKRTATASKSTSRSRPSTQRKRTASRSGSKTRAKGTASRSRSKSGAKRTTRRSTQKAQPAAGRKTADDGAIARNVESTLFRDIAVDKDEVDVTVEEGVVKLGGQVPTPDLIKELEARANRVTDVRRVENQLHVAEETPSSGASEAPTPPPALSERPGERDTTSARAVGVGSGAPPVGSPAGVADSAVDEMERDDSSEAEDSSTQDEPDTAGPDQNPPYRQGDPSLHGTRGG